MDATRQEMLLFLPPAHLQGLSTSSPSHSLSQAPSSSSPSPAADSFLLPDNPFRLPFQTNMAKTDQSQFPRDSDKIESGSLTLNLMHSWPNKSGSSSLADLQHVNNSQQQKQQQIFSMPSSQITQSTRSALLSMVNSSSPLWSTDQDLGNTGLGNNGGKSGDQGGQATSPSAGGKGGKDERKQHLSSGSDDEDDLEDDSVSLGGEEGGSRKRKGGPGKGKGGGGAAPHAMSHLMTERRRREKLNAQFLALRGVVPNITKMNKLSTLEDAINYIKSLQQKVSGLEKKLKAYESGDGGSPSENPQGCISNVSSHSTMDTLRRMGSRQSSLPRQSDLLSLPEATEKLPVDVDVKLVDGEQFIVNVRCKRRRGLLVEIGAAMDTAALEIQQASVMSSAQSVSVNILTMKVGDDRKGQAPGLESGLKDLLSVQKRALVAYVSNLCGDPGAIRH